MLYYGAVPFMSPLTIRALFLLVDPTIWTPSDFVTYHFLERQTGMTILLDKQCSHVTEKFFCVWNVLKCCQYLDYVSSCYCLALVSLPNKALCSGPHQICRNVLCCLFRHFNNAVFGGEKNVNDFHWVNKVQLAPLLKQRRKHSN